MVFKEINSKIEDLTAPQKSSFVKIKPWNRFGPKTPSSWVSVLTKLILFIFFGQLKVLEKTVVTSGYKKSRKKCARAKPIIFEVRWLLTIKNSVSGS